MSTNFIYDPTAVHKKAGIYAAIRRVDSFGNQSGTEYFFDIPVWEKLSSKHDTAIDEFKNAHGDIVNTDNGDVKSEKKFTLIQDNANVLNFIMNETSNQPFSLTIHRGNGALGYQEFEYNPYVKISTSYSEDYPGRNIELTITPLAAPSAWNCNSLSQGSVTGWGFNFASVTGTTGAKGSYGTFFSITG